MNRQHTFLQKIAAFVIKTRFVWASLFTVLLAISVIMMPKTKVTYDLTVFVPKTGLTGQSIELMRQEFDDKGSLNILFEDVENVDKAHQIASELSEIEGVKEVAFDPQSGYKNNSALFNVTLNDYDSTEGANNTVKAILAFTEGKQAYISGQSAGTYYTRRAVETGILTASIIIAVIIIIILLLTSKTYFEIVIMLIVFGVAALLNMGSHFIFPEISYLSNYVGVILQLVLAIDYSIILLHRFLEELEKSAPKRAMVDSLSKGIPEILSSSLTTISGMGALMLMALPLGFELGAVLAKGIVLSLVTVVLLMPFLLIVFNKAITSTKHKPFLLSFNRAAKQVLKAKKVIAPLFAVLILVSFFAQSQNVFKFNMTQTKDMHLANDKIEKEFGKINTLAIIVPKGDYEKERQLTHFVLSQDKINSATGIASLEFEGVLLTQKLTPEILAGLSAKLGITPEMFEGMQIDIFEFSIIDLIGFISQNSQLMQNIPPQAAAQFEQLAGIRQMLEGENYSRILFNINAPVEGEETFSLIEHINEGMTDFYEDDFYLVGESVGNLDVSNTFSQDNKNVVIFTALFVFIILLITFKNFLQSLVLLLTIQGSIWLNFAVCYLIGDPITFIGYLIISAIQMGATIDYAIILTNRFRTIKAENGNIDEAMSKAVGSAFPTIITSGGILALAGFILQITTNEPVISSLGLLLGIGTSFSVLMVLFVLPSLLVVLNRLIEKTEFKLSRRKNKKKGNS